MEIPILKSLHVFWETWNLRFFILFSLSLQTFLILFASIRKRTSNIFTISLIWSAYLLADWAANFAVGILWNIQGKDDTTSGSNESGDLLAFWAPFLLLHLGGPDTITAFALEDNELWIRHLIGLVLQLFAAFYVFFDSLPTNTFWIPTMLVFLAGLIKYAERTRALYLASWERFSKSILRAPDQGPNYEKLIKEYNSKIQAGLPVRLVILPEPDTETADENIFVPEGSLTDIEVVQHAYQCFKTFRGLLVDLIFRSFERNQCRDFFLQIDAKDAFILIEVELNFIYEALFTKAEVVHCLSGYIFRFISFASVVVAFGLFFITKKDLLDDIDVRVTYTLLIGAISLDLVSLSIIILSDWAAVTLPTRRGSSTIISIKKFLAKKFPQSFFRRWSESIATYNLISFCVNQPTKKLNNNSDFSLKTIGEVIKVGFNVILEYTGLEGFLEQFYHQSRKPFTDELRDFVFYELRTKSKIAENLQIAKEICVSRGSRTLCNYNCRDLLKWVDKVEYDESLLLWHIATEICYNNDEDFNEKPNYREFSKCLSDYMLYLLVMQPTMMSAVTGIGQILFGDICKQAKSCFSRGEFMKGKEMKEACTKILEVITEVRPIELKGDRGKSVLFDACMLAKELNELETKRKWEMMSRVWVELMSYAAINCRANTHAQQVSKGGELLTFVWLLMTHFGLGGQFAVREDYPRAKLIVGK